MYTRDISYNQLFNPMQFSANQNYTSAARLIGHDENERCVDGYKDSVCTTIFFNKKSGNHFKFSLKNVHLDLNISRKHSGMSFCF